MSSSSSEDEEFECKPQELLKDADDGVRVDLLPPKSREKYWGAYDAFTKWKNSKGVEIVSENLMMDYFGELSQKYKPSSLWCKYSMLRSTIQMIHNINIGGFKQLLAFLKQLASGYEPKKSKALSRDDAIAFLNDAPDDIYLITKVMNLTSEVFINKSTCINIFLINYIILINKL